MKSKYDNEYKRYVLLNKFDRQYLERKQDALREYIQNEDVVIYCNRLKNLKTIEQYDCADRLLVSRKVKNKKVRNKIEELILSDSAIFITLTFNNETLENTSFETRRRYVARYLKSKCKKYVANVDYGKKNGREHYHAVVDNSFIIQKNWDYGFEDAEIIGSKKKYAERSKEDNLRATSKYITKLTNHALKNGYDMPRLIYSRNTI